MDNVLYVGNLPFDADASELRERFGAYGEISKVEIVVDRAPARTRCFGVVTMKAHADATRAIRGLNGTLLSGRSLVVSWLEGRVLSAKPAAGRETTETVAKAVVGRARSVPETREVTPVIPQRSDRRGKNPDQAPAEKPTVRMMQQFRQRASMTYELECSGVPFVVQIFFPGEGPTGLWRVEARASGCSEPVSATAPSKALALESIARTWHDRDATRTPTKSDWDAIRSALAAVRAI